MKEIKAYVRPVKVAEILHHLEAAGIRDLTVIHVEAIGALADPRSDKRRLLRTRPEEYSDVVKLEVVCRDDEVEQAVQIIREHGRTGAAGDGRVFVSPVEHAVSIRTGKVDEEAL